MLLFLLLFCSSSLHQFSHPHPSYPSYPSFSFSCLRCSFLSCSWHPFSFFLFLFWWFRLTARAGIRFAPSILRPKQVRYKVLFLLHLFILDQDEILLEACSRRQGSGWGLHYYLNTIWYLAILDDPGFHRQVRGGLPSGWSLHLLLFHPQSVRSFGPLWATSELPVKCPCGASPLLAKSNLCASGHQFSRSPHRAFDSGSCLMITRYWNLILIRSIQHIYKQLYIKLYLDLDLITFTCTWKKSAPGSIWNAWPNPWSPLVSRGLGCIKNISTWLSRSALKTFLAQRSGPSSCW